MPASQHASQDAAERRVARGTRRAGARTRHTRLAGTGCAGRAATRGGGCGWQAEQLAQLVGERQLAGVERLRQREALLGHLVDRYQVDGERADVARRVVRAQRVVAGVQRPGPRVVREVEVGQRERRHVEHVDDGLLLPYQDAGDVGQSVHIGLQGLPVVPDEAGDVGQGGGQVAQRGGQVVALPRELFAGRGELLVEQLHLRVALGQRGHEPLQVGDGTEEVVLAVGEGAQGLGETVERGGQVLPAALEVGRAGGHEVAQRALLVGAVRSQRLVELVQRPVDLVQFQRDGGALHGQVGAVRQRGAAGVGGEQLHVPVAHHARRDDGGHGVGRDRVAGVVAQLDPDRAPLRPDRHDLADPHPEHPHVRALVDADRAREVGDQPAGHGGGRDGHRDRGSHRHDHDERRRDPQPTGHQRPPTFGWYGWSSPARYESNHRPEPSTLVNAVTNGAMFCTVAERLSRLRCRFATTSRSCASAGPSWLRLSATRPEISVASWLDVTSRLWMASRRAITSGSRWLPSATRFWNSVSRSGSTPLTPWAWVSRSRSSPSRAAIDWETWASPANEDRTLAGVSANVCDSVLNACASWPVSICCSVSASPLTACMTSNGDAVRFSGICAPAASFPGPAGASARYFWPSTVLMRMVAPVVVPSRTDRSSIRNSTRT